MAGFVATFGSVFCHFWQRNLPESRMRVRRSWCRVGLLDLNIQQVRLPRLVVIAFDMIPESYVG
jgi:hypothetical protein